MFAAIAILGFQAWSTFVFVIFAVAMAVLARPHARRVEVIGMALAIGGSAVLGFVGLYLIFASQIDVAAVLCAPDPCPGLRPALLISGTAVMIGATLGAAGLVWYIRQRARVRLLLPAFNVIFVGLFAIALIVGARARSGNTLVEIAGLAAATGALRLTPALPRLLKAAVVGQAADLVTFGFVWQFGRGEQNTLGRWTMEALLALGPSNASWEAAAVAGVILILAKLALIGFLIWVTPQLGRYRFIVLLAATLVGTVGAASNILAMLPLRSSMTA
jgi:hypothetical protein